MPEEQPAQSTPWWGHVLAGAAILFSLPSLMFVVIEGMLTRRGLRAGSGGALDTIFVLTGVFAPFLTPVGVLLCMYVLVMTRIRIGLRVATAAIVAVSLPATYHLLKAFTGQFK